MDNKVLGPINIWFLWNALSSRLQPIIAPRSWRAHSTISHRCRLGHSLHFGILHGLLLGEYVPCWISTWPSSRAWKMFPKLIVLSQRVFKSEVWPDSCLIPSWYLRKLCPQSVETRHRAHGVSPSVAEYVFSCKLTSNCRS